MTVLSDRRHTTVSKQKLAFIQFFDLSSQSSNMTGWPRLTKFKESTEKGNQYKVKTASKFLSVIVLQTSWLVAEVLSDIFAGRQYSYLNIFISIFSISSSQLRIISGMSSVRYLFCRQARQAIFLSQCFLLFLL